MSPSQQNDIPPLRRQAPQDIRVPGIMRPGEDRQSARRESRVEMQLCVDLGIGCFLSWPAVDHYGHKRLISPIRKSGKRAKDVPLIFECACENARKKSATVEKLDTIPPYTRQPPSTPPGNQTYLDDRTSQTKLVNDDVHHGVLREPCRMRSEFGWAGGCDEARERGEEEFCSGVACREGVSCVVEEAKWDLPPVAPCFRKSPLNWR